VERKEIYAVHGRFSEMLKERNAQRGGKELALTSTATTVRKRNSETVLSDGPYAEAAEQLGGFYLVEAEDLEGALEYAKVLAELGGIIDVRPVVEYSGEGN
jgi:hypothetical protein